MEPGSQFSRLQPGRLRDDLHAALGSDHLPGWLSLACGLRSYRIRETEAWRRRGLPWGPPAASEPTPPALDGEDTPREVWKGRA